MPEPDALPAWLTADDVDVPGLYVVGDKDMVTSLHGHGHGHEDVLRALPAIVPELHDVASLPGCGHWKQQERPAEVNDALIGFLRALDG